MISATFIQRPILSSVLSIIVVIAGLVAMVSLPVNQYPAITPVQVTVSASYPGADAETVAPSRRKSTVSTTCSTCSRPVRQPVR
jgi:multidrug efflux pump